ncbi:MAG TPA: sterol desaturase family protein [Planctomycetota bacterium]|nr:sterol desaturase family protein [Planctomycetota bacterium]
MHATHHRYENPRPLSLFVMSPLETAAFGMLWLAVLRLYAPTWNGMALFMTVNLVSGVLGHVGVDPHPRIWSRVPGLKLVSTSVFHNRHHLERDRNLGFYTVIWDRLFGTWAPARETGPGP